MSFELREFGELYAVPSRNGVAPPKSSRGEGVPMVNMGDLFAHARIRGHEMERVPLSDRERERALLEPGDLLFARRSLMWSGAGACSIFRGSEEPTTFESSLIRVRVDRAAACPDFLFYLFRSPVGREIMETIIEQTAVAGIKASMLARLQIPLPPLAEQRRIASVLGAFDDKIDSNRRLAGLLEQIAQTEFQARFVSFVGVDSLTDREQGPIPAGWEWRPVSALARYINGKAFTKFGNGCGRMVIRIADLKSGPGSSTVYTDHRPDNDDFIAKPGDILFAWSGSLDVYRWHREEALINQHIFKVVPDEVPKWLVYFTLREVMPRFQAIAADKATTMGHIKRSDLARFAIPVPPEEELRQFDSFFSPIFNHSLGAAIEAQTLTGIRDALLPKLVSGEIRLPDMADPNEVIDPLVDEAA